jgi:hypothetical protein
VGEIYVVFYVRLKRERNIKTFFGFIKSFQQASTTKESHLKGSRRRKTLFWMLKFVEEVKAILQRSCIHSYMRFKPTELYYKSMNHGSWEILATLCWLEGISK